MAKNNIQLKILEVSTKYVRWKITNLDTQLEDMDEWLTNMDKTGHSFRIGDQEEKIIKILLRNPCCFCYSIKEFNDLVNEICENEKCDEITAIEKYI